MFWNHVWIDGADCIGPCIGLMVKTPPFEETTLRRSVSVKNGGGKRTGCNAPRFQIVEAVRYIDEMFSDVDRCCIGSHGALRGDAPW